jgi:hypothetical protein
MISIAAARAPAGMAMISTSAERHPFLGGGPPPAGLDWILPTRGRAGPVRSPRANPHPLPGSLPT